LEKASVGKNVEGGVRVVFLGLLKKLFMNEEKMYFCREKKTV
jgi:hypothetical protein